MMDDNQVSGLMTLFLYGIDKAPDLGPSIVDLMADDLVNQIHYRQPVQDYFDAFGVVLSKGQVPPRALEGVQRYSPAEVLDFVGRLHAQLDRQRPWPRPRFAKLDLSEWPSFATAKGIARIAALSSEVEARFNEGFDRVPTGAGDLPVLMLELRSGEKVAVMGSTEPGSRVYTLLAQKPGDAAATIDHFREFSGFTDEQVAPLT